MYHLSSLAYGGQFCEMDQNGCSQIECFPGVVCFDVPAPGVGAMCGPCPHGLTGDGEKCNGTTLSLISKSSINSSRCSTCTSRWLIIIIEQTNGVMRDKSYT